MAYAWRADSFYDAGIDKKTKSVCYRVDHKLSHELDELRGHVNGHEVRRQLICVATV
jgi:hypothetical protein